MQSQVNFSYFNGEESEQFSYFRIPRLLVRSKKFKTLSTDAKLLYGLMLDRMGLSAKHGWYDELGRVYIYYTLDEIQTDLMCGHNKAVRLLAELDTGKNGFGLIERVKQGQGRPAKIYVKKFTTTEVPEVTPSAPISDFPDSEMQTSQKQTSRLPFLGSPDFLFWEVKTSQKRNQVILIIIILSLVILIHLSPPRNRREMDGSSDGA